jgi:hypothetical protein
MLQAATPTTRRVTRVAGVVFVLAWIVGLIVAGSGPDIDDGDAEILRHYLDDSGRVAAQSLLVHGLAAVALVAVIYGVRDLAARRHQSGPGNLLFAAGFVAAVVSLLQMTLGLLAATTLDDGDLGRAGAFFDAINRLDGVKLALFCAMVGAGCVLAWRGVLPRWLGGIGVPFIVMTILAAVGFLILNPVLAAFAAPSLGLLLAWVAGAAFST